MRCWDLGDATVGLLILVYYLSFGFLTRKARQALGTCAPQSASSTVKVYKAKSESKVTGSRDWTKGAPASLDISQLKTIPTYS